MQNIKDQLNYYFKKIKNLLETGDLVHAAGDLRVVLEIIVDSLGDGVYFEEKSLFEKIDYLYDNNIIDDDTNSLFHRVRKNTNEAHHEGKTSLSAEDISLFLNDLENVVNNFNNMINNSTSGNNENKLFCDDETINTYLNNAYKLIQKNNAYDASQSLLLVIEEICEIAFNRYPSILNLRLEEKLNYLYYNKVLKEDAGLIEYTYNQLNKAKTYKNAMDITVLMNVFSQLIDRINNIIDNARKYSNNNNGLVFSNSNDENSLKASASDYYSTLKQKGNVVGIIVIIATIFPIFMLLLLFIGNVILNDKFIILRYVFIIFILAIAVDIFVLVSNKYIEYAYNKEFPDNNFEEFEQLANVKVKNRKENRYKIKRELIICTIVTVIMIIVIKIIGWIM